MKKQIKEKYLEMCISYFKIKLGKVKKLNMVLKHLF